MAPTVAIRKEKRATNDGAANGGIQKPRRGPKPKPLSEKVKEWKFEKPKRRQERSYTRERKIEVIMFLLNHRVPDTREVMPRRRYGQYDVENEPPQENPDGTFTYFRAPTYTEASEWWKIPTATICSWWDKRETILAGTGIELPPKKAPDAAPPPPRPPKKKGPAPNPPIEWFKQSQKPNTELGPAPPLHPPPRHPAPPDRVHPGPLPRTSTGGPNHQGSAPSSTVSAPTTQAQSQPQSQPQPQPQPQPQSHTQSQTQQPTSSSELPPGYHVVYAGALPGGGAYLDHPSQVAAWPRPGPGQPQCWVVVYYGPPPPPYGNFAPPGLPGGPPLPPQPFPPLKETPRQPHHGSLPPMFGPQQGPPPQHAPPRQEPFPGAHAYQVQDPPLVPSVRVLGSPSFAGRPGAAGQAPRSSKPAVLLPRPPSDQQPTAQPPIVVQPFTLPPRVPPASQPRLAPVPIPRATAPPPPPNPAVVTPRRGRGRPRKTPVPSPIDTSGTAAQPIVLSPSGEVPASTPTPTAATSEAVVPGAGATPSAASPIEEDGLPYETEQPTGQTSPTEDQNHDQAQIESEGQNQVENQGQSHNAPQAAAASSNPEAEGGSGESTPYATPQTAPEVAEEETGSKQVSEERSPLFSEVGNDDGDVEMTDASQEQDNRETTSSSSEGSL